MDPLKEMAWALPEAVAVEDPGGRWTHADLDARVDLLAYRLMAVGAGPRVRVATLLPMQLDLVAAVHAVPRTGAVLSPLNPRWSASELRRALEALEPVILLCDRNTEHLALDALAGRHLGEGSIGAGSAGGTGRYLLLSVDTPDPDAVVDPGPVPHAADRSSVPAVGARRLDSLDPVPRSLPGRRNDEVVAVLWTSGSSGVPRGVELTLDNLLVSARAARKALDLRPSDAWLASLSPAHVGGLALVTRAPVVGCRLVLRGAFRAGDFSAAVDEGDISHASLVPTMLHQVLDERGGRPPPASFRCVLVGGARAPAELLDRAHAAGFPVALTYGMTETTSQATTAPPDLVRRKPGTVGAPLPGVQLRVPRDGGEVLIRGPVVGLRYLGGARPLTDAEGWLHTGDTGHIDDEGHLWITGRISERIISGGVNVEPAEVERFLREHGDVREVVVLGVPDPLWGERVVALLVVEPGIGDGADWDRLVRDLDLRARRDLTAAKRPRAYLRLDGLPLGPTGKVDRGALAARAAESFGTILHDSRGDRIPPVPSG